MDTIYQRIMIATDLGPQSLYIGQHALRMSQICQAQLYVLHTIELPITYTTNFSEREKDLQAAKKLAEKSLNALCDTLKVTQNHRITEVGDPQFRILEAGLKHQCDLIIVGSHGVGGYTHALGSTAHHLLENAYCDVLIVQVSHLQQHIEAAPPQGEFLWKHLETSLSKNPHPGKPNQYGSEKGFGEVVRRGPRLSRRPPNSPYHGGTRSTTSDGEEEKDKDK